MRCFVLASIQASLATTEYLALVGLKEAGNNLDSGRFAGTVGVDVAYNLAGYF